MLFSKNIIIRRVTSASLAVVIALAGVSPPTFAIDSGTSDCKDVEFIFARGSGEELNDTNSRAWQEALLAEIATLNKHNGTSFSYDFYELGANSWGDYQYPAAAVSGSITGFKNVAGAVISRGEWFNFGESVSQGINELWNHLYQVSSACSTTRYVLGGYSQGAMVITKMLNYLSGTPFLDKLIYVATFGDPKLYLPEGKASLAGALPEACSGNNLSDYRENVPNCRAYEGVLGGIVPYRPSELAGRIGTWCNLHDIMCSNGASISDHTSYAALARYAESATRIGDKLYAIFHQANLDTSDASPGTGSSGSNAPSDQTDISPSAGSSDQTGTPPIAESPSAPVDRLFILDGDAVYGYTAEAQLGYIRELATQTFANGGRVALVRRDYGDSSNLLYPENYPYTICDFACSRADIYERLDNFIYLAGNFRHSMLDVLSYYLTNTDWSPEHQHEIYVFSGLGLVEDEARGHTIANTLSLAKVQNASLSFVTNQDGEALYSALSGPTGGKIIPISGKTLVVSDQKWADLPEASSGVSVSHAEPNLGCTSITLTTTAPKTLVVVDETVLGFVEETEETTTFALCDLVGDTAVTLIPFIGDTRGIATSIIIPAPGGLGTASTSGGMDVSGGAQLAPGGMTLPSSTASPGDTLLPPNTSASQNTQPGKLSSTYASSASSNANGRHTHTYRPKVWGRHGRILRLAPPLPPPRARHSKSSAVRSPSTS